MPDKEFIETFNEYLKSQPPYQTCDLKIYNCGDGEELYEEGGVVALLNEMKPLFDEIGMSIDYSNDSYLDNQHSISLNGRHYILAEGSLLMWGETIARFAEMINSELELIDSKERIYLMSNDNEYMVFLTIEQYQFICANISAENIPLPVDVWTQKRLEEIVNMINGNL